MQRRVLIRYEDRDLGRVSPGKHQQCTVEWRSVRQRNTDVVKCPSVQPECPGAVCTSGEVSQCAVWRIVSSGRR